MKTFFSLLSAFVLGLALGLPVGCTATQPKNNEPAMQQTITEPGSTGEAKKKERERYSGTTGYKAPSDY